MRMTIQIPEILTMFGCVALITGSSLYGYLLLGLGLSVGFIRWTLDLAEKADPNEDKS